MKKIFLFIAAALVSTGMWATTPDYESYDWASAEEMATGLAGDASVAIAVSTSGSDANVGGHWYKPLNGAIDGSNAKLGTYLSVSSAKKIDSVAIFFCPNGTSNTNIAWAGWGDGVTPVAEVGTNYGTTESYKASKSWDAAIWQTIDLSDKEIYTIYMSRQGKKLTNNTQISNFGDNQTVNVLGIRVWLASGAPVPTYTVTYKANNGSDQADIVDSKAKKVAACTFYAQEGMKFDGWNTAADGTGDDYAVGDAVESDLTLYAQWTKVCYKVIYDFVGGIGSAEVTAADATVTENALIMSNTAGRITLTPAAGQVFKNGDIIEFEGTVGNSSKPFGIKIGSQTIDAASVTPNDPSDPTKGGTAAASGVLKLDGDAATIAIARSGGTTTTLLKCVIKREADCGDPTGIENANAEVKAVKVIRNGQLLIKKGDVFFNAQGAVVK